MKKLILGTFAVLLFGCATQPKRATASACPIDSEAAADCPWASMAREMSSQTTPEGIRTVLKQEPRLYQEIESDSSNADWLALWGVSSNFDELAKHEIVEAKVLRALVSEFHVEDKGNILKAAEGERTMAHAGVAHTYGYLFSDLVTKYGFKRARWVLPTLDLGLGLKQPTIAPIPSEGTLFSNVTYFAGRIAFVQEPKNLAILEQHRQRASSAVREYDYAVNKIRLSETVVLSPKRTIVLKTDLVPFKYPVANDTNSFLLVYSVKDGAEARLISAFPVDRKTAEGACDKTKLGEKKPVTTRYNAVVEGLTGQPAHEGTRAAEGCEILR